MSGNADGLVDDLIAQATMDSDQGREEYSVALVRLRQRLIDRMEKADAERDRSGEAEVRPVLGGQDPADQERGPDLPGVRRVAADPGAAEPAARPPGGHHIMTSGAQLAVPDGTHDEGGPGFWVAAWGLWACGPCKVQDASTSVAGMNEQISAHLEGR